MKRIKYLFLATLLFGTFTACDNKEDNPPLGTSKIEIKASVEAPQSIDGKETLATSADESKLLLISDEIVSYNAKSGEIIFKSLKSNNKSDRNYGLKQFLQKYESKGEIEFYKDGQLLFKLKMVSPMCSARYFFPVLYLGYGIYGLSENGEPLINSSDSNSEDFITVVDTISRTYPRTNPTVSSFSDEWKFYILDGYGGMPIGKRQPDNSNQEIVKNTKKISDGWNIFIETLKKEGKYIK